MRIFLLAFSLIVVACSGDRDNIVSSIEAPSGAAAKAVQLSDPGLSIEGVSSTAWKDRRMGVGRDDQAELKISFSVVETWDECLEKGGQIGAFDEDGTNLGTDPHNAVWSWRVAQNDCRMGIKAPTTGSGWIVVAVHKNLATGYEIPNTAFPSGDWVHAGYAIGYGPEKATPTITAEAGYIGDPLDVSITWDRPLLDFDVDDITVSGATKGTLSDYPTPLGLGPNPTTRVLRLTDTQASVTVTVPKNISSSTSLNGGNNSASKTFTLTQKPAIEPTVRICDPPSATLKEGSTTEYEVRADKTNRETYYGFQCSHLSNEAPLLLFSNNSYLVQVEWPDEVTGFSPHTGTKDMAFSDQVSRAQCNDCANNAYTTHTWFTVPDKPSGEITVTVKGNAITNPSGNARATKTVLYGEQPKPTITFTNSADVPVTEAVPVDEHEIVSAIITWKSAVTGFNPNCQTDDLLITRVESSPGTSDNSNLCLNNFQRIRSSTNTTWIVEFRTPTGTSPLVGPGKVEVKVPAGVVENSGEASAFLRYVRRANATIRANESFVTNGSVVRFTVRFSESVKVPTAADFSVSHGSVTLQSATSRKAVLKVTAPQTGSGTISITLPQDKSDIWSWGATASVEYGKDIASPSVTDVRLGPKEWRVLVNDPTTTNAAGVITPPFIRSLHVYLDTPANIDKSVLNYTGGSQSDLNIRVTGGYLHYQLNHWVARPTNPDDTGASRHWQVLFRPTDDCRTMSVTLDEGAFYNVSKSGEVQNAPAFGEITWSCIPGKASISSTSSTSSSVSVTAAASTTGGKPKRFDFHLAEHTDFSDVKHQVVKGSRSVTATFSGLKEGTEYYVRSRAKNVCRLQGECAGSGPWSDVVSITTGTNIPVPDPPGNPGLSLTAEEERVVATITAPTGGGEVSEYRIQLADNSSFSNPTERTRTNTGDESFIGLTPGTNYYVQVRAENNDGNSDWQVETIATSTPHVPNQSIVDAVNAVIANHVPQDQGGTGNEGAWGRLLRVLGGILGEDLTRTYPGGTAQIYQAYTSQECRDTANSFGVIGTWGSWCDEIARRESQ